MSKSLTLMCGPATLKMTPEYFIFSVSEAGRASPNTRKTLGPPRFRSGRRADHFTWPRHPAPNGRHRGKYNLHLTYEPGDHHTVLVVDPRELEQHTDVWMQRVFARVRSSFRRVSLEELQRDQWYAVRTPAAIEAKLDRFIERMEPRFRFKRQHLREFTSDVELVDPVNLDPDRTTSAPIQLLRATDDTAPIETIWLKYMPLGMAGDAAGWYALPQQDDIPQRFIELAPPELSEPFIDAWAVVIRELELEVKLDAIEALRRRVDS